MLIRYLIKMVGYQNNIPNMNMNTKYELIANAVRTRIAYHFVRAGGRMCVLLCLYFCLFSSFFSHSNFLSLSTRSGWVCLSDCLARIENINDCHHVPLRWDSVLNSYYMEKDMLRLLFFSSAPEHRMRKKSQHTHIQAQLRLLNTNTDTQSYIESI